MGRQKKTMSSRLDFSKVVPVAEMKGEDPEETLLLEEMFNWARAYLESFDWCAGIVEAWFGLGVGRVVAVFLFKIIPRPAEVDEWIWVIVGNLPPAYIVIDDAPNPACALNAYMIEMKSWIAAIKSGSSVADLIPVNAPPTIDNTNDLEGRLGFIKREILAPFYGDELRACSGD